MVGAALGFALLWLVSVGGKLAFGKKQKTFTEPAPFQWTRSGDEAMLTVGDRVPEATVWLGPGEGTQVAALGDGQPFLLLFYLFDWSST